METVGYEAASWLRRWSDFVDLIQCLHLQLSLFLLLFFVNILQAISAKMTDTKDEHSRIVEKEFDLRLISEFDGKSDVTDWIRKVVKMCRLRKVSDVATVMQMRLSGDAYAVVDRLSDEDQLDVDKVSNALIRAFGADPFSSYDTLMSRKLEGGESVDVYLADIEKLAKRCGILCELPIKCAFISGLPQNVRHILRANTKLDDMPLDQVLDSSSEVGII